MTSKEIDGFPIPDQLGWAGAEIAKMLREIAFQLAVANEQRERNIHDELAREYLKGVSHGQWAVAADPAVPIYQVLQSCALTIEENGLGAHKAAQYIKLYADAVLANKPAPGLDGLVETR